MDQKVRLGSIILWPRSGLLADSLSWAIKRCDRDPWIRQNYDRLRVWPENSQEEEWPWHSSQVVGYDSEQGFIVDEAVGPPEKENWLKIGDVWVYAGEIRGGDRRIPLNLLQAYRKLDGYPTEYLVVDWFPPGFVTQSSCDRFIEKYGCKGYGSLDYLWTGGNRMPAPWPWCLGKPLIPARVMDENQYCWERTWLFTDHHDLPFQNGCEMPFIPNLFKALQARRKYVH